MDRYCDSSVVQPFGEWYDRAARSDDRVAGMVIDRALAATRVLHEKQCTWTGGMETYLFHGWPLKDLAVYSWALIPDGDMMCRAAWCGAVLRTTAWRTSVPVCVLSTRSGGMVSGPHFRRSPRPTLLLRHPLPKGLSRGHHGSPCLGCGYSRRRLRKGEVKAMVCILDSDE